jgi:hypothetical protein
MKMQKFALNRDEKPASLFGPFTTNTNYLGRWLGPDLDLKAKR